jgi:hypothetical protein
MSNKKEILFQREKSTKNMVRFSEVIEEGQPPFVRTVYVPKYWIGEKDKVKVTYEIQD